MSRRSLSKKRKIPISAKVYTMAELQSSTNGLSEENFLGRSSQWTDDAVHSDAYMTLSWGQCLRIALGVARALDYLHSTCLPPVSHSNLKATNILLDEELMRRLSDCGLAVLRPLTSNNVKLKLEKEFRPPMVEIEESLSFIMHEVGTGETSAANNNESDPFTCVAAEPWSRAYKSL